MIAGIGCDLANIERFERLLKKFAPAFVAKIFSPLELKELEKFKHKSLRQFAAAVAKRFAAKEACVKALGSGFSQGIAWSEVEIWHQKSGKPELNLLGKAKKQAQKLCLEKPFVLHLSITDDYPWAQAFVIIEII